MPGQGAHAKLLAFYREGSHVGPGWTRPCMGANRRSPGSMGARYSFAAGRLGSDSPGVSSRVLKKPAADPARSHAACGGGSRPPCSNLGGHPFDSAQGRAPGPPTGGAAPSTPDCQRRGGRLSLPVRQAGAQDDRAAPPIPSTLRLRSGQAPLRAGLSNLRSCGFLRQRRIRLGGNPQGARPWTNSADFPPQALDKRQRAC